MNRIIEELIERYPQLDECKSDILSAFDLMCESYDAGGKVLTCGNGGSAADADHIVGELMKGFLLKRELTDDEKKQFSSVSGGADLSRRLQRALPAISLCAQASLITAFMNDCSPEDVFAQQVFGYSQNSFDCLIALSTSGNSANVVNAVIAANALGINSVAITGSKDSRLSELSGVCIKLPETETFKIQELTLPVYHCLCAMLEEKYFG